ncbi:MAG: putative sulfate exporter family transporter [Acidobacteriaceae bacterium]
MNGKTIFFLGLLLAASGIVSPPVALAGGIAFGLFVQHPFREESQSLAKFLLQISVVALGFGMNLRQVVHAGRSGFVYTAGSISLGLLLGVLFGRLFRVGGKASFLISAGTAICGGSAIAAISPINGADEREISVSMGTVFVLNSIALLVFPAIGHLLHLNQNQFGLWAALAIHDTSSVVGAAAKYGNQALAVGTTVKLARALWIVPVSLLAALYMTRSNGASNGASIRSGTESGKRAKIKFPWFILLFCLAAAAATYLPSLGPQYAELSHLGKTGLTATLFLIGTGLSKKTLQQVGIRPFLQGVTLWVLVASVSLAAIYFHYISI